MDDVLPMVNNLKAHIARVEAELAQAYETIVLLTEAALVREKEIARLREALEEIEPLRMALLNIRDAVESCYVAGGWVPLDTEEMGALSDIANAALKGADDATD